MKTSIVLALLLTFPFSGSSFAQEFDRNEDDGREQNLGETLIDLGIDPESDVTLIETENSVAGDKNLWKGELREDVASGSLRLAGRSMIDKKTGEGLALACLDEKCLKIRFVYFDLLKKAHFIGSEIDLSYYLNNDKSVGWSLGKQRKVAMKKVFKDFTRWKSKNYGMSEENKKIVSGISFLICAYGPGVALFTGAAGIPLVVSLSVFPVYLLLTPMITGDIKIFKGVTRITEISLDQGGWNWATDAKKIKHKTFKRLMEYFSKR